MVVLGIGSAGFGYIVFGSSIDYVILFDHRLMVIEIDESGVRLFYCYVRFWGCNGGVAFIVGIVTIALGVGVGYRIHRLHQHWMLGYWHL